MTYPNLKFNGKRVTIDGNVRVVSPYPDIPADTLRFEFLGSDSSFNPNTDLEEGYQWAAGTWTNVYGSVWDWTYHNPKWYRVGYSPTHAGPYLYTVFSVTPSSNPGEWYSDEYSPLYTKRFRVIGGNTSNITHMPKLFYKLGQRCREVGWFDTHNVVNAASMFYWTNSKIGMNAASLPDFDFSGITNDQLTDERLSTNDRANEVGLYRWCANNRAITRTPNLAFPSNRSISTDSMFTGCASLETVTLSGLHSSKANAMFYKANAQNTTLTNCSFADPSTMFSTTKLTALNMSNVSVSGNASQMFNACTYIETIPMFDTSSVTNMQKMFNQCTSLKTVTLLDTSAVTNMISMFDYCTHLTEVPLFNTSSATSMNTMFRSCRLVESGALSLYTQASTQETVPTHTRTFTECGIQTVTGAAELAQIPAEWGGTGA